MRCGHLLRQFPRFGGFTRMKTLWQICKLAAWVRRGFSRITKRWRGRSTGRCLPSIVRCQNSVAVSARLDHKLQLRKVLLCGANMIDCRTEKWQTHGYCFWSKSAECGGSEDEAAFTTGQNAALSLSLEGSKAGFKGFVSRWSPVGFKKVRWCSIGQYRVGGGGSR